MNDCENKQDYEECVTAEKEGRSEARPADAEPQAGAQTDGTQAGQENAPAAGETCEPAEEETANGKEGEDMEKPDREGKEKGRGRRELQQAREEAEKWKSEAEELKRKWYAVTAEYDNYRRRTQNQAAQKYAEGRSDVIAALFGIGDNLERALSACADPQTRQGVEMVLKSYKKVLEGEGVEELDPTGQPFDAAVAEAIMAVPAETGEAAGVVKQVYVKGYKRGEKILRYAQVIVTQ